jgi:hypothetical protein
MQSVLQDVATCVEEYTEYLSKKQMVKRAHIIFEICSFHRGFTKNSNFSGTLHRVTDVSKNLGAFSGLIGPGRGCS